MPIYRADEMEATPDVVNPNVMMKQFGGDLIKVGIVSYEEGEAPPPFIVIVIVCGVDMGVDPKIYAPAPPPPALSPPPPPPAPMTTYSIVSSKLEGAIKDPESKNA